MTTANTCHLILGGARSGKSHYAETLAKSSLNEVTYIATAQVFDDEIAARVFRHKSDRPQQWLTIEEPLALSLVLKNNAKKGHTLLVDCLTMWMTNLLTHDDESILEREVNGLLDCLDELEGTIIFVSNEVGMGVIPMGELTRRYVDEAGRLHQQLALRVQHVVLMVAGLPHTIKSPSTVNGNYDK